MYGESHERALPLLLLVLEVSEMVRRRRLVVVSVAASLDGCSSVGRTVEAPARTTAAAAKALTILIIVDLLF